MSDKPGTGRGLPPGMRFWRRTGLPDQWWPWGVMPLLGLLVLFALGLFGIAAQIESQTEASVREALADFGVEADQVKVSGQSVQLATTGPASAAPQLRAVAMAATCDSWLGSHACATDVSVNIRPNDSFVAGARLDLELPVTAPGPSVQPPEGRSSQPLSRPTADSGNDGSVQIHDFSFSREADRIVLRGDVPDEAVRQGLILSARGRFERVTPELEITERQASPEFEAAAERALEVLEKSTTGIARWDGRQLFVVADAPADRHAALRAAFNRSESAPPLGGINLEARAASSPASGDSLDCRIAFDTVLGERPIAFETGSAVIAEASRTTIDTLIAVARRCRGQILVEGHTDNVGLAENNQQLSLERARAVVQALVSGGVDQARLRASGLGEMQPIADNSSPRGRALNRRIVMSLQPPLPALTGSCEEQLDTLMQSRRLAFETGSTRLDQDSRSLLSRLAMALRRCPGQLVIESHTDNVGLQANNRALSLQRARAVQGELVGSGLPAARLSVLGLGEDLPVTDNETEANREQNRRTVIRLVSGDNVLDASACERSSADLLKKQGIEFNTGSHHITDDSQPVVSRLARLLMRCDADAMVAGHTDDVGDEYDNQRLSWRRANAVKLGLVDRGLPPDSLHAVGFGESQPLADNTHKGESEDGRAANRRIEIMMLADTAASSAGRRCNEQLESLLVDGALVFPTGSDALSDASRPYIARAASILKHCEGTILVEGHSDNVGDENNNQHLSWRRARSVRQALADAGLAAGRVVAAGFGESRPRTSNETAEGRASNRRISIHVDD